MEVQLDWIRHGKTISNAIRDTEGFVGFFKQAFVGENLHEEGIRQTQRFAEKAEIKKMLTSYDFVFCSMLPRSIQTALILFPNTKIFVAPFLNEYRPWWAMGLDIVNRPSKNLEELKEKIESEFSDSLNTQNLSFDYILHSENSCEAMNQSYPDHFYHFLTENIWT